MSDSTLRLPGRIAIFAVAHAKYWAQFPTLKGKLQEYHTELCKKLTDFGAEVTDFGMIRFPNVICKSRLISCSPTIIFSSI